MAKKEVFNSVLKAESLGVGSEAGEEIDICVKKHWEPAVDLFETDSDVFIHVELPGISKDEIRFLFSGSEIILKGKKPRFSFEGRLKYICIERPFGDFERVIHVPTSVNPRKVKAAYSKGILKLKLPKVSEKRNNLIEVPLCFDD